MPEHTTIDPHITGTRTAPVVCPVCNTEQNATIEDFDFGICYSYFCTSCNTLIGESEWQEIHTTTEND